MPGTHNIFYGEYISMLLEKTSSLVTVSICPWLRQNTFLVQFSYPALESSVPPDTQRYQMQANAFQSLTLKDTELPQSQKEHNFCTICS